MSDSGTMKILKNRNNFSNIENSHFLSKELVARPDKACEITTKWQYSGASLRFLASW